MRVALNADVILGIVATCVLLGWGCTASTRAPVDSTTSDPRQRPADPSAAPLYSDDDLPRSARALHQLDLIGERAVPPQGEEGYRIEATSTLIHGLDVSHWQASVDWGKVAAGKVVFAFAKASEAHFLDRRFPDNWTRMAKARQEAMAGGARGFFRGAYHFYRATEDPVEQAQHFIRTVGRLEPGDLPPTLDLEWDWTDLAGQRNDRWDQLIASERVRRVKLWLDTVEQAFGRPPIIYTNYHFWQDKFGTYEAFQRYPLWIADYSGLSANAHKPLYLPRQSFSWQLWQFTCYGLIEGIPGYADVNRFNGDLEDLKALAGLLPPRARVGQAPFVRGSHGPEIERLQEDLVALGHLQAAAKKSGPGILGPRTEQALLAFQRLNYLTRTGAYDQPTRNALAGLREGFRSGSDHEVVRAAKEQLVRLGYLQRGDIIAGSGSFGAKTEAGLERFQKAGGLRVDGVLTMATYRALNETAAREIEPEEKGTAGDEASWAPATPVDPDDPG